MNIYEKRQRSRSNAELYRRAAIRLNGGTVSAHTTPVEVEGGAMVEMTFFVPEEEMEQERELEENSSL